MQSTNIFGIGQAAKSASPFQAKQQQNTSAFGNQQQNS